MPFATVPVAYVNQPREGKKYGSIKSTTGEIYSVKPAELALFTAGQSYEIEYQLTEKGYRNFVRVMPRTTPQPQASTQREDQARHIFITGVVGRAMGSGKFELADISALTEVAADAWDQLTAAKQADEEIPF